MRYFIASLCLPLPFVPCARPAFAETSTAYVTGAADRTAFEAWFSSLTGGYRTGAEHWAAHRSIPKEASCKGDGDQLQGCLSAQQRLAPSDARRKAEPDYKLGWNSFQVAPPSPTLSQPPAPEVALPVKPTKADDVGQYTTVKILSFGCDDPSNAMATGQMAQNYSGSISFLVAQANAYNCFWIGTGAVFKFIRKDDYTGALLMGLNTPVFALGRGKIEELWIDPSAFVKPGPG